MKHRCKVKPAHVPNAVVQTADQQRIAELILKVEALTERLDRVDI